MWLLGPFAGLALILAGMGISSVISYAVSQRTHEIGIRMALGASHEMVIRMVVAQGSVLATMGVALGLLGSLGLSRVLSSLPVRLVSRFALRVAHGSQRATTMKAARVSALRHQYLTGCFHGSRPSPLA
jgi:ABC-type antimicrobial peptide transport system permease subunit